MGRGQSEHDPAVARVLRRVQAIPVRSDRQIAEAILAQGRSPVSRHQLVANLNEKTDGAAWQRVVGAYLASEWAKEPDRLLKLFIPTIVLPRLRKPRWQARVLVADVITADDWRQLVEERWEELADWRQVEYARWLINLLSLRDAVEPKAPARRHRDPTRGDPAATAQIFLLFGD